MEYANCFIAKSFSLAPRISNPNRCKMGGMTITGLAKLLAFGDFLKAKASKRNMNLSENKPADFFKNYILSRNTDRRPARA